MQREHTAIAEKDLKMIDFSSTKELDQVMDHIAKKVENLGSNYRCSYF